MANTLEISGNLLKKVNNVTKLTVAVNPSYSFTEYTETQLLVSSTSPVTVNLGGISYPKFMYIETDNAITLKCFRGANVVASSLPCDSSLLITGNNSYKFGTVSITNVSAGDADVHIYMCG